MDTTGWRTQPTFDAVANLRGANLTNARFLGANLRGADLSTATVTSKQVAQAITDRDTKLPVDWEF